MTEIKLTIDENNIITLIKQGDTVLVDVHTASKTLNLHPESVRRLCRQGKLPHLKLRVSDKFFLYLFDPNLIEAHERHKPIKQGAGLLSIMIKQLRSLRKSKGMSQVEMAQIAGLSSSRISEIERGVANPSMETLSKMADALDHKLKIEFTEVFSE